MHLLYEITKLIKVLFKYYQNFKNKENILFPIYLVFSERINRVSRGPSILDFQQWF